MPQRWTFSRGRVHAHAAWSLGEVKTAVEDILDAFADRLPADRGARVLIKPNLNNDLVALVGNSADLRVLAALIEGLQNRGYRDLTLADGSNVGVARRGIDTFKRLRVDRLAERYGVRIRDLNQDEGVTLALHGGARPAVARAVLDADFLISVPKIKTHAEAGLSCAMKNWVGICTGQQKREMHRDLGRNILAINEAVLPDLIVVDGLVGMEGNGPGDGTPVRLGRVLGSDDAFLNDLVVAQLVGLPIAEVPYLCHAVDAGYLDEPLRRAVAEQVPLLRRIAPAPQRSRLAELSEARSLHWLKLAVRPLVEKPAVAEAAYRLRIIQDVYSREDDTVQGVRRSRADCGECVKCAEVCPTGLTVEEVGVKTGPEDCVGCLYCWWVCPDEALSLEGELGHLERQIQRYKAEVEAL
ncbi:MAG: DUF362 domain-containing protein [Alphaproteobacteria bacterium]|nr:DUF362 domain-containing protein [Alphaproteobacteria bacterium]